MTEPGPQLARERVSSERGYHRVFLGMAAGVGKTYRMLLEGRAEQQAGRDVVIGLLETHGRADTAALAEGLMILPRRRVAYRETTLEEMDLPAIIAHAPEICLIDEIAHTNAPGVEHHKRYEDVEDVLDAGIDVLSTVNVQHLESLNDQIAELTGIRVRETIPDAVLDRADQIAMIDLAPETLLERLRAGKVYPRERIDAAPTWRSRALTTAEPLGTGDKTIAAEAPQAVGERLLALVEPHPGSQRLVRRAWRSAQRLGAALDLLWVSPPGRGLSEDQERSLAALRQLASVLGTRLEIEESDDIATAVADFARRRRTTYVLLGRSHPARGLAQLRRALPQRLMELLPGVDVRIVADRALRTGAQER